MVKHITVTLFGYQIFKHFLRVSPFEKMLRVFTLKITTDLIGYSKNNSHSLLSHSSYTEK